MQPSSTGTLLGAPPLVFQPSRVRPSKSRIQPSSGPSAATAPVGRTATPSTIPSRPAATNAIVRIVIGTSIIPQNRGEILGHILRCPSYRPPSEDSIPGSAARIRERRTIRAPIIMERALSSSDDANRESTLMAKAAAKRSGRVVVITGVTRGLGRALAEGLVRAGHRVVGC